MVRVYIIEGWFGDNEWIEAVYASELKANERVNELWVDRRSTKLPKEWEYFQGLCKFDVVEHEVIQ